MRSVWVGDDDMGHVLALLMPENRLAMETALHTGLRISDVLALRSDRLAARMSVREAKTGKTRRISLTRGLLARLRAIAGPTYVFTHAHDETRHRARQTVWTDVKRAARALRMPANVSPHSARKVYAVAQYRQSGDIDRVARLLNHDDEAVTLMYAMADQLARRRGTAAPRRGKRGPAKAGAAQAGGRTHGNAPPTNPRDTGTHRGGAPTRRQKP